MAPTLLIIIIVLRVPKPYYIYYGPYIAYYNYSITVPKTLT